MKKRAEESGLTDKKFDIVSTSTESLAFGHGRHACPGRFFAAAMIKLMLAELVLRFDVRTIEDGVRPKDLNIIQNCIPNPKAEILFRRRAIS